MLRRYFGRNSASVVTVAPLSVSLSLGYGEPFGDETRGHLTATVTGGSPIYTYTFFWTYTGACNSASVSPSGVTTHETVVSVSSSYVVYSGVIYTFHVSVVDALGNSATATVDTPSCILPDSRILLSDGLTVLPAGHIKAGMLLHHQNGLFNKATSVTWHTVMGMYVINKGLLSTTDGHVNPIKGKGLILSRNLKEGMILSDKSGKDIIIESVDFYREKRTFINVSTSTGYYVANDIITHNKAACP